MQSRRYIEGGLGREWRESIGNFKPKLSINLVLVKTDLFEVHDQMPTELPRPVPDLVALRARKLLLRPGSLGPTRVPEIGTGTPREENR